MIRQFELVENVKAYDPSADEDALNRAYVFAMKAHGSQKRASGDPYFSHPLEVAGILTDYRLDASSIITALLHDTVEDTLATSEEIREQFGEEIMLLVDGVTKLTQIELQSDQSDQAENFRKLVLAMSEDIRVLLVKLADRLHNMRTLNFISKRDKRRRIALETMEIYAPLAERIGMQEFKNELEDLSFAELNPEARESITSRLQFLRDEGKDNVETIVNELKETLAEQTIKAEVYGREKSPYSIWRKSQKKNISFEQVSDIIAFRIVVDTVEDCYRALGVIHGAYLMVPGRFKDYISTPKPNGYQSLHTGVIGPERQRIEIQIRAKRMHEVAEMGVAAHWQYKQNTDPKSGRQYRWMRELLDIMEHADNPEDFLEHTKLEMFPDQVFSFTPKGEVIALPAGATAIDFAYAVHSEIGDTCVGTKINGRPMPLRTVLENGDQVEVITSPAQTPSPTWENFATTGKARACIRRFIRLKQREEYITLGKSILERGFQKEGYEFAEKAFDDVLTIFNAESTEDLYSEVGAGHINGRDVIEAVFPGTKEERHSSKVVQLFRRRSKKKKADDQSTSVPIKGLIPGMALHFAGCCHALPGDRIVGIVTKGRGLTIHTIDCVTLEEFADTPERWIDVSWEEDADNERRAGRIEIVVTNEPGSLGELSMVIAKNDGNINNLKITNRSQDFFDISVDIEVHDLKHLRNIIAALRASPVINTVERVRG
ncbi:MAG: bifunctional (p)ppGpp synthetase/guanosine-3',5'-bis(diphosphate) 3'-pyrophosphohydrolase [Rhodospirillaceae bacterium]|jgi:GTP diphosphokinase / guanosine-3',5'-bis(diphosphate) 3'-diphosphatase|nr:bifunctional (p)ppGpp synthetase/guanosine-3',5'-bis(diphosphate) 3'-pyrophosphohydrolase [Rhodospirillaceae bacterium]MBT5939198.1 bifunctional (p)ppGpp synthetase/guanosine-3',5'-bis(diphosphate) 3'-pyrophosphohydrolase [Rhodospirillaceae bacterium]MBT7268690.1 bifunctional (p)ppGpp synthetase/guanosine-3',5'-bis(diphosphate) 3'-pyrophosphohydrolase [Rhodospirillaceae bacterium]